MATLGVRARMAVEMVNPCDISVMVANTGTLDPCVQVILNGAIVSEVVGLSAVTLSFIAGVNKLELVAADGGLFLGGQFLNALGLSKSLYYPPSSDPFHFAGSGGGPSGGGSGNATESTTA